MEEAKQRKNMEVEEKTNGQKLEAEQKVKQNKRLDSEEKTRKLESKQKAKQSKRLESVEEAKQSKNTLGLGQTLTHLLVITEEERVVLNIGGQCFSTSRVTLWADPSSLIGLLLRKNCPMHPHRNTCFLIGTPVIVPATFLPRHKKWPGIMLYPSTF